MQDHSLGHSGAGGPDVVEHLDLVTAELRRRIAGIGLAIAELREETGRLRASADGRYHAVAVLDRPVDSGPAGGVDELCVAPQPMVIEPIIAAPEAPVATGDLRFEPRVAEPVSPWSAPAVEVAAPAPVDRPDPTPDPIAGADIAVTEPVETIDAPAATGVVEPTLTWVPEPAPVAVLSPVAVAPAVPAPLWADGDDEDSAAFEAFFSAEIEPEPSQRWLLSD